MKKTVKAPSDVHKAFDVEFKALIQKYGARLSAQEILALTSSVVGQVLALQDQRVAKEIHLEVVMSNIESGNASVVDALMNAGGNKQ